MSDFQHKGSILKAFHLAQALQQGHDARQTIHSSKKLMVSGEPQPPRFGDVHKGDVPKEYQLRRYYTAADIAEHNTSHDCWVSFYGKVYVAWIPLFNSLILSIRLEHSSRAKDLTPLLAEYQGPLAQPIIAAAGSDISFWFDEATGQPVTHVDPVTQMKEVYCPWGRYIHVLGLKCQQKVLRCPRCLHRLALRVASTGGKHC